MAIPPITVTSPLFSIPTPIAPDHLQSMPQCTVAAQQLIQWAAHLRSSVLEIPEFQGDEITQADSIRNWMKGEGKEAIEAFDELYLDRAGLTCLPPEIALFRNITILSLRSNNLSTLPSEISQLKCLVEVHLQHNLFEVFPPALTNLPSLKYLDLSRNQLESLPPQVETLNRLRTLHLSHNLFSTFPDEMKNLKNLNHLFIDYNVFYEIPPVLGSIPKLQTLQASYNPIQELHFSMGDFPALAHLYLNHISVRNLPDSMECLSALRILYLQGNHLSTLPSSFWNLHELQELDLINNNFSELNSNIKSFQHLWRLGLRNNQLNSLPEEMGELLSLTELDLSYNSLNTLPPTLSHLSSLNSLNLANNRFSTPPLVIQELKQLAQLDISQNPIGEEDLPWLLELNIQILDMDPTLSEQLVDWHANFTQAFAGQQIPTQEDDHWSKEYLTAFSHNESIQEGPPDDSIDEIIEFLLESSDEESEASDEEEGTTDISQKEILAQYKDISEVDFSPLLLMAGEERELLRQYLSRVVEVKDYITSSTQNNILLRVERMVQLACVNPEFRRRMISLIGEALESCSDRVMLIFNEIEIQWHFNHRALSDREFKSLSILASRYTVLQQYATKIVQEAHLPDEIETTLYLQMRLHKRLHLPITISGMNYPEHAKITEELIELVRAEIKSYSAEQLLAKSELWLEHMDQKYPKETEEINTRYQDMIEDAGAYYDLGLEDRMIWVEEHRGNRGELCEIVESNKSWVNACNAIREQRCFAIAELDVTITKAEETRKRKRK